MSKKSINKKSVILTAGLGITIGTAAAIIPPLLNREVDKKEVIQVVDWKTSNVGLNNASVSFKLNLEDAAISKKAKAQLDQLKELKVNVIEPKTAHIESVNTATLDPQTNEFSFDVSNLNAGKIYNFNVVSLPHINFFFEINNNASFIVTKPELSRVDAQLDKRNAQLTLVFADDEHILNNKQAVIKYRKVSEVETKDVESVVKLEEVATSVGSKIKEIRATFDLKDLDRDTEYYIQSVEVDNEAIPFSSKAERAFKTSTPTTTLENLEQTESTKNSAKATLSFDNSDIDIKDKQVNVYYAKVNKDETGETIGYGDELALESQTLKLEDPAQPAKLDLEFAALEEGSSYIITRITTIDPSDSSKNIEVIVPKEKEWSISTKAAIQSITHDTTAEKSDFMRVVLKDDSFTNNSKRAYVKYKLDSANESEAQIAESDITGNNVRFLLINLTGLKPYSVLEFGLVTEAEDKTKTYTAMEFLDSLIAEQQRKMKSFVPTVSNVTINSVEISAETETTATVKVTFKKEDAESVLNRKAQVFVKGLGEKETYKFPSDADAKVEDSAVKITKEGELATATFSVTGLEGGIEYTVGKIELVEEDSLNEAENKLKADFSLEISGEKRTFHTKPVVKDISYRGNDTSVTLAINIKNAYRNAERQFENKQATVKYQIKDTANTEGTFTATIKNNFINHQLTGLTPNKTYVITSITVEGYQTSTQADSNNLLSVSSISEEKKQFFTTSESANIVTISSTAQSESTSQVVLTFDEPSAFLADEPKATLELRYRKVGTNEIKGPVTATVDKQLRQATFDFSELSIGTQYIIDTIVVQKVEGDLKPVPKILFDASSVKEAYKIFRTTNGISAISASTSVETKARVTISLADANEEYANKQVKITYAKKDSLDQETVSQPVSIINGKAVFDLVNLSKVTTYTIKNVKLVNGSTETDIPFEAKIQDAQKEFTTNAQTATVSEITQLEGTDRTKNSAKVTVKFQDLDQYLKDGYDLKLKYRLRGTKEDKEQTSTYDDTTKLHTFEFTNLKEGAVYYITGFSAQKDGKQIEVIIDKISDDKRIFWTKATVSSISVNTQQEEQAKLYVRFNDANRDLIKKQVKVVVRKLAEETSEEQNKQYEATATSDSGLFIFNLTGLPKATEMKVMKFIYVSQNNEEIEFGTEGQQTEAFEKSRKFTTSAKTATVTAVTIAEDSISRTGATVKLTFSEKEAYLVGKKIKLQYRGQGKDAAETEEQTIADDRTVSFTISGLEEGIRYTVTGFDITDFKYPNTTELVKLRPNFDSSESSSAKAANRIWVTKSAVNEYDIQQKSETSLRVVVLIADNAKVKNGFKATVDYKNTADKNAQATTTSEVVISNGKAIFEVSNLTKSATYIFENFKISGAANSSDNMTVLEQKDSVTEDMRTFTLVTNNISVTEITPTQTDNSGTIKIKVGEAYSFVNGKNVTLKVRRQGSQDVKEATATFTMEQNTPVAEFSFTDLLGGSIYQVTEINIEGVPKTVIAPTVADKNKQIATTPDIVAISFLPITETNWQSTILIKDPLSGSQTDDRKFDNKNVKITYHDTTTPDTKLTATATVQSSRLIFNLDNLTKNRDYVVEKVEYADTTDGLNAQDVKSFVFNSQIEESKKQFHVIARTATVTEIEQSDITDDSATVVLKFDKTVDEFMSTLGKQLKLKYKTSALTTQTTTEAVAPVVDGDKVTYTFNLTGLGHGAFVRLIQAETEGIKVKFDDKIAADKKEINTVASVRQVANSKADAEGHWNISVYLKDLNRAYDTSKKSTKLKITYGKTSDTNDSHTSEEVEIADGKATFELSGLEKFIDYTLKTVELVWENQQPAPTTLKFEDTVKPEQKQFKVIPRIATVEAITDKVPTTTSSSFVIKLSDADRNYINHYNEITLKYRLKGTDQVQEKDATIDKTTLKANFAFTVGQDNFKQGNYEIFSVIFKGDVIGSTEVNPKNPNNVKIVFDGKLNKNDKSFETSTEITSIVHTPLNAGADVTVRLKDTSSVLPGGSATIVYTKKNDTVERELSAIIGASTVAEQSEAVITLTGLEKENTYVIKQVKINGGVTPFIANFDEAQKEFKTTATEAEVIGVEATEPTINSQIVKVKFSDKDKFLFGSRFVEPNTTARQLVMVFEATSSGAVTTTAPQAVTEENGEAVAIFNLTGLASGETFTITAINERGAQENEYTPLGLSGNINFASSLTQDSTRQFKTKPAVISVIKNTQIETKANITFGLLNDNLTIQDNAKLTLEYKLVGTETVLSKTATYSTTSKGSIAFELTDLQKNKQYQIVALKNGADNVDFISTITDEQKQFTTIVKTADATISVNSSEWQEEKGTFTVTFGNLDDYVNDGWTATLSYTTTDATETKRTSQAVNVTNKQASFEVTGLTGGQFYKVTDVVLRKDSQKINAIIKNPVTTAEATGSDAVIKVKSRIRDIISVFPSQTEANIRVAFDNAHANIPNSEQLTITYEWVRPENGNSHQGTAQANITVDNNNNNTATFTATNLERGIEYKIVSVKRADNTEIKFNTSLEQDTVEKRKFRTSPTSAEITTIAISQLERTTATATITFANEFTKEGQRALIFYREKAKTANSYNTEIADITNKQATFNITGLKAGTEYEIYGGTITTNGTAITQPTGIANIDFVTKPEVSAIKTTVSSETAASIVVTVADEKHSLNTHQLKLTINKEGQTDASTQKEITAAINNGSVTFSATGLDKFTVYEIKSVVDTSNSNTEIPFSALFGTGQELEASKKFKTKAQTAALTLQNQVFIATNGTAVDANVDSVSLKFTAPTSDQAFLHNRNAQIKYRKLNASGTAEGNEITSPVTAKFGSDGSITFVLNKATNGLESGTGYQITAIEDLSPASEKVNITVSSSGLNADNKFYVANDVPKVATITAGDVSQDQVTNPGEFHYKVTFDLALENAKNEIIWSKLNEATVTVKRGKIKESDNEDTVDSSKVTVARKGTENVIQVTIDMEDIRKFVARDLLFEISGFKYNLTPIKNQNETQATITTLKDTSKLKQQIKAKLFVETLAYPRAYSNEMFGVTLKVYDPAKVLTDTPRYQYDGRYTQLGDQRIYLARGLERSPYRISAEWEYVDAFGSVNYGATGDAFSKNSDGSDIINGFAKTSSTKASSGFKLKQETKATASTTFTTFQGNTEAAKWLWSQVKRDTTDDNYAYVSIMYSRWRNQFNSERNAQKLANKTMRLKVTDFTLLHKYTNSSDVSTGHTLLNPKLSEKFTYSYPTAETTENQSEPAFTKALYALGDVTAKQTFQIQQRDSTLSTITWDPNKTAAIINSEFSENDNTLKFTYNKPDNVTITTAQKGYAVLQDDAGNLYFAGDSNGDPVSLTPDSNNKLTFHINPNNATTEEKAPINTKLRIVGIWTQDDSDSKVYEVMIRDDKYIEVLKEITLTH